METVELYNSQEQIVLDDLSEPVKTGTTIMAVQYKGGIVIGADSRTTSGALIVNRVTDKLTPVADKIFSLRSGSAADTQEIAAIVRYYLNILSTEQGKPPTVKMAANLFRQFCYVYKNYLLASIICAGYDETDGPSIYSIPLGGAIIKQPYAIGGSGSTYLYGYCDANFKEDMTKEECVSFVTNAVGLAIARDGSSGGIIRYAIIDSDGVERHTIYGDQVKNYFK
ncbi:proteasome subunit beta [Anaeramoeba ignava]|uniref:Proteasome subunit beta n=1 Tax=Anaeramoeba ignava TaxID=1746090 RepID=A0A9Q0LCG4_ANAIG|nr:proteasome subunit beta [Anaeramoeba ignava]